MGRRQHQGRKLQPFVDAHLQYLRDENQKPSRIRVSVLNRLAQAHDAENLVASALDGAWVGRQLRAMYAGKAQNTKRTYIGIVRAFVTWGRKIEDAWDITGEDVPAGKTTNVRAKPARYFTGEWLRDLWEAQFSKPGGWYFGALIAFCCMTLIRGSSELVTIKVEDMDLDARKVGIVRHKVDEGTMDRITMTRQLTAIMRTYLAMYEQVIGRKLRGDEYLFPAFRTNGATGYDGMVNPYKQRYDLWATIKTRIVERLPEHERSDKRYTDTIGSHTLRRSYARFMYETLIALGVDNAIVVVQGMLGHATPEITLLYIGKSSLRATRDDVMDEFEFFADDDTNADVIPLFG
jgi:integrase